jgi:uncharacterized protein HemX
MIQDYSRRTTTGNRCKKRNADKKMCSSQGGRVHKVIGALIVLVMGIGICISFWMSREINESLHQLSVDKKEQEKLMNSHESLMQERDGLLSREKIEMAAVKRGLFQPTKRQVYRP